MAQCVWRSVNAAVMKRLPVEPTLITFATVWHAAMYRNGSQILQLAMVHNSAQEMLGARALHCTR
jgi:hypothetical protein